MREDLKMKRKVLIGSICLLVGALLGFCKSFQAELNAQAKPITAQTIATPALDVSTPAGASTSASTLTPTIADTPTLEPTFTPVPSPTSPPALTPLSAADIFARVSPAVAFIETPAGTGSGVLVDGGFVLTNAHVVWPFREVRVVFPDGTEYANTVVMNWDLLRDLAVVGPLDTSIGPVPLEDGEGLVVGSNVYLIGYPGEVERFPQPTITRGVISRMREWQPLEITYFQTDATITGGQSGGVLVSEAGQVIGISGLSFSWGEFGLVASTADLRLPVQRLIAGEDVDGLGDRHVSLEGGQFEYNVTLDHSLDAGVYVLNEPAGTVFNIAVESENDVEFGVTDVYGNVLAGADTATNGVAVISATIQLEGPHFLELFQSSEEPVDLRVTSDCRLIPYIDVDDGDRVIKEKMVPAALDYPGDLDYFVIDLAAGDSVTITISSVLVDPFVGVAFLGVVEEESAFDDDGGEGLFGLDAELSYTASRSGSHLIVIGDASLANVGGYLLSVATGHSGANPPTVMLPQNRASTSLPAAVVPTPDIPMAVYESAQYPFVIEYPAGWVERSEREECSSTKRARRC
jgi:S1-C subfamily serine protease